MLEEKLKEIGFSEKEVSVYLCIFQYQKISPARIATLTHINRPTVYNVAEGLIQRGLIAEDKAGKIKYFVSLGESAIQSIVNAKQREIFNIKEKIPTIIESLKQLPKQGKYSIPKIQFIDESRLRDFFINRSAVWAESALTKDNTWWGYQDHTLLEHYQDWADHFFSHFPKTIKLNLLTNKKEIETQVMTRKTYAHQRNIIYWDGSKDFTATHVVVGDYVLMIVTNEHPHYLIEVCDKVMADNTRELFKSVWRGLKKE